MKYFEERVMQEKTDVATKLFEAFLEQRMLELLRKLDDVADHIGVTPDEARRFLKPIVQKLLDKHFPA